MKDQFQLAGFNEAAPDSARESAPFGGGADMNALAGEIMIHGHAARPGAAVQAPQETETRNEDHGEKPPADPAPEPSGGTDAQGNPVNADGSLRLDAVASVDDITDGNFTVPKRSVRLPHIPANVAAAIGANGKPVVIKRNIFARNATRHSDLSPETSREILAAALYSPDIYGRNQKASRPYNWVVVNTRGADGRNKLVLLEVNDAKDNVEIVHWHFIDGKGLEKLKKQAAREDGQLLILPSGSEEAGALSGRTRGESSPGGGKSPISPGAEAPAAERLFALGDGQSVPQSGAEVNPHSPEPSGESGAVKRQAARKGGQLLVLRPSGDGQSVGTSPSDLAASGGGGESTAETAPIETQGGAAVNTAPAKRTAANGAGEIRVGDEVTVDTTSGGSVNAPQRLVGTVTKIDGDAVEIDYRDGWGHKQHRAVKRSEIVGAAAGGDGGARMSNPEVRGVEERLPVIATESAAKRVPGIKVRDAYPSVFEAAFANMAAQPNYVHEEKGDRNCLVIDGHKWQVARSGIRHGSDRRFPDNSLAAASIGDLLNASVEITDDGISGGWRYRVARLDAADGSRYVLVSFRDEADHSTMESIAVMKALNAKRSAAAQGFIPTDGAAKTGDSQNGASVAELRDAFNQYFKGTLIPIFSG